VRLLSLAASTLRMNLDVGSFLESVITHMPRGTAKTEELLPDRWKAANPEAVREYRAQKRRDNADTAVMQAARRRVRAGLRQGTQRPKIYPASLNCGKSPGGSCTLT